MSDLKPHKISDKILESYGIEALTAEKVMDYYNYSYPFFLKFKVLFFKRFRDYGLVPYSISLFFFLIIALVLPVVDCLFLCLCKFFNPRRRRIEPRKTFLLFPTSSHGGHIIKLVCARLFPDHLELDLKSRLIQSKLLSWGEIGLILPKWALFLLRNRSLTIWLYAYDFARLFSYTAIVRRNPEVPVFSDDHFQRWAILFASFSKNFHMCQHGKISSVFAVGGNFGNISNFHYRDEAAVGIMQTYFGIDNCLPQAVAPRFTEVPEAVHKGRKIVFLASSLPHYDKELRALRELKSYSDKICVIHKRHPSHIYSIFQKFTLKKYSEFEVAAPVYPSCDFLICAPGSITELYENTETKVVLLETDRIDLDGLAL
ncbi:hypothetical protein OAN69_01175 [Alphaproteobacteria bacterium]|nr:hypothetical protein [Alphaproteobacteria bacterium]